MSTTAIVRIFFLITATFCFSFLFSTKIFAATLTHNIQTEVEVVTESTVKVTQTHRLTWDNAKQYFPAKQNFLYLYIYPLLKSQEKDLATTVTNISLKNVNNEDMSFTKSVNDGFVQLKTPYYKDLTNENTLTYTLTYYTSLYILKEGGLIDVQYPGLSQDYVAEKKRENTTITDKTVYLLTIKIPEKFGKVSVITPQAIKNSNINNSQVVEYNEESLKGNAVRILVGDKRYTKFTLYGKTTATNTDAPNFVKGFLVNYIEVALPTQQEGTEFANQSIYYTKIEPYPIDLQTDRDGNIMAKLPVSATENGRITIEGYAIITAPALPEEIQNVDLTSIPSTMGNYLVSENQYWQSSHESIKTLGETYKDKNGNLYNSVVASLGFVTSTLSYEDITATSILERKGALVALTEKKGVCMEYADLLLSMLRAEGIPTRAVFGAGIGSRVDRTLDGVGHQWVGTYFPSVGWLSVDPTWSEKGRKYIGYDYDHFIWFVASKSVNDPSGFNCQSSDETSPCKEALSITTEAVNEVPVDAKLFTIKDIRLALATQSSENSSSLTSSLQKSITYLSASRLGRFLFSTTGLMLLFAFFLYFMLVTVVSFVMKSIRKNRVNITGKRGIPKA